MGLRIAAGNGLPMAGAVRSPRERCVQRNRPPRPPRQPAVGGGGRRGAVQPQVWPLGGCHQ
eukprot:1730982-Lingulodinium_polyedra.AAC.1